MAKKKKVEGKEHTAQDFSVNLSPDPVEQVQQAAEMPPPTEAATAPPVAPVEQPEPVPMAQPPAPAPMAQPPAAAPAAAAWDPTELLQESLSPELLEQLQTSAKGSPPTIAEILGLAGIIGSGNNQLAAQLIQNREADKQTARGLLSQIQSQAVNYQKALQQQQATTDRWDARNRIMRANQLMSAAKDKGVAPPPMPDPRSDDQTWGNWEAQIEDLMREAREEEKLRQVATELMEPWMERVAAAPAADIEGFRQMARAWIAPLMLGDREGPVIEMLAQAAEAAAAGPQGLRAMRAAKIEQARRQIERGVEDARFRAEEIAIKWTNAKARFEQGDLTTQLAVLRTIPALASMVQRATMSVEELATKAAVYEDDKELQGALDTVNAMQRRMESLSLDVYGGLALMQDQAFQFTQGEKPGVVVNQALTRTNAAEEMITSVPEPGYSPMMYATSFPESEFAQGYWQTMFSNIFALSGADTPEKQQRWRDYVEFEAFMGTWNPMWTGMDVVPGGYTLEQMTAMKELRGRPPEPEIGESKSEPDGKSESE